MSFSIIPYRTPSSESASSDARITLRTVLDVSRRSSRRDARFRAVVAARFCTACSEQDRSCAAARAVRSAPCKVAPDRSNAPSCRIELPPARETITALSRWPAHRLGDLRVQLNHQRVAPMRLGVRSGVACMTSGAHPPRPKSRASIRRPLIARIPPSSPVAARNQPFAHAPSIASGEGNTDEPPSVSVAGFRASSDLPADRGPVHFCMRNPGTARGPLTIASALAIAAGLVAIESCGGGGSASSSAAGSFALLATNVQPHAVWQINRPIQFKFSASVDFASVNLNTISITQSGGGPATGEFHIGAQAGSTAGSLVPDPSIIVFQPACPKLADFSDAGLLPGGAGYVIDVRSGVNGVRSTSNDELANEETIDFVTPSSTESSVLFMDPTVGPPLPRIYDASSTPPLTTGFCYVESGADPDPDHGARFMAPFVEDFGDGAPASFRSPLNLYSDATSSVAVVLELNQPVDPSTANVNASNIRFEYLTLGADASSAASWKPLPHTVALVANCTATGARIRITPLGILPQARIVRVVLTSQLMDLVGESNPLPVVVGSFVVGTALDPGTSNPGVGADELFEPFDVGGNDVGSLEDTTSPLVLPRAAWGDGRLTAAFAFGGTGGPGGNFDWQVGDDSATPLVAVTLDTTFTLITNLAQSNTEAVINGIVDVRNFTIKPNGRLIIQGPHPCKIVASGTVKIQGELWIRGSNNPGVNSFNSTNIPEPGASGQGGGGRGGSANYLTTQSTPIGEAGFGAFNAAGGGGGGGESAYNGDSIVGHRRPGGGGGGAFGADLMYTAPTPAPAHPCPDQSSIGLDAEPGFSGAMQANGALHPIGTIPAGGAVGPRPFVDGDPTNDFWGTMLTETNQLIQGELAHAWAGSGGGGGGNACDTDHFPTTPFSVTGDEKGAGGGGGAGSLTILALGDIVIGRTSTNQGSGVIDATGGTGGGGENTNGLNHVGGGSGGGSGGHVILQTASSIDFTRCTSTSNPPGGIHAFGGQAGQGFIGNNGGGGAQGGDGTTPYADALPSSAYPSTSTTTPCPVKTGAPLGAPLGTIVYTGSNTLGNSDPVHYNVDGGGDGGPGIIQLHVSDLANIKAPTTPGETFYKILKPLPIGATLANINQVPAGHWDRLLPIFGPKSQALSKWIPLGAANVDPASNTPRIVSFFFHGTNTATGKIETTGSGAQATVAELPSIFTSTLVLHAQSSGLLPYVDASDFRTVVFDSTSTVNGGVLGDDVYTRDPDLVKQFALKMTQSSTHTTFDVGAVSFDAGAHRLRVTVSSSGLPLQHFAPGDGVDIRPRFFRVSTQGTLDSLPQSPGPGQPGSAIKIEFQATSASSTGDPDESGASQFETDVTRLDDAAIYPNASSFRFVRFRVTFDLLDGQGQLTFSIPVPSLEFFRVPFKF
jgi:hypothetical protein